MITDNLLNRTLSGLTHPLAHHQGAPLGWLISEKLGLRLLGANEYGLRMTSFVAGVGTVLLAWWLARRVLTPMLVPLAVGAVAVAPQLIRYSSEAKQYGSDAFAVTLVVAVAVAIVTRPSRDGPAAALLWAVAVSLAVLLSHPGIFATCGCGLVVLVVLLKERRLRALAWVGAASLVVGAVLLTYYELMLKEVSKDPALKYYWRNGNPPHPVGAAILLRWIGRAVLAFTHDPLKVGPPLLVALLFAGGLVGLYRRSSAIAALIAAPLVVQLVVSAAGIFPLSGRLVLGYVPLVLLVMAAAPLSLGRVRWASVLVGVVLIGALAPNVASAADRTAHPLHFEELRPVLEQVRHNYQPGDLVFVHYPASMAAIVYSHLGLQIYNNGTLYVTRTRAAECQDGEALQQAGASGHRIWFISAHQLSVDPQNAALVRAHLGRFGTPLLDIRRPGSEALLVRVSSSSAATTPIDHTCLNQQRTG